MKNQKSEKVKLIDTILKGKKSDSLKAIQLLKNYKNLDLIVFFGRDDGFFESNTCKGIFTRDEITRDFQNPIIFQSTKAMREKDKNL